MSALGFHALSPADVPLSGEPVQLARCHTHQLCLVNMGHRPGTVLLSATAWDRRALSRAPTISAKLCNLNTHLTHNRQSSHIVSNCVSSSVSIWTNTKYIHRCSQFLLSFKDNPAFFLVKRQVDRPLKFQK